MAGWSVQNLPSTGNTWYFRDVVWAPGIGGGLFVAVGQKLSSPDTSCFRTSPDGVTWTTRTAPEANQWRGVTYSPTAGAGSTPLLVAVSTDGTNRVATSPDGITWTARSAAAVAGWRGVTWAPSLALFCAVGATGTFVMTSPDGITWTSRTGAASKAWGGICWSPDLSLFVAVAGSSGTTSIQTSPDGTNWTSRTNPNMNTTGPVSGNSIVTWSSVANKFCAMLRTDSPSANDFQAVTSPDGITWTAQTMPNGTNDARQWENVVADASGFTITSQRFGNGTANNCVATSSTGASWVTQDLAGISAGDSGAFSSALGRYVFGRLTTDSVLLGVSPSISPTSGKDDGGITVTINGDGSNGGFTNGHQFVAIFYPSAAFLTSPPDFSTNYSLGTISTNYGLQASNVTWIDANTLTCTNPHGSGDRTQYGLSAGAAINAVAVFDITKVSPTPNLQFYKDNAFTYIDPVMVSATPQTGPTTGGTIVTVTGTNFYPREGPFGLGDNFIEFNNNIGFATYVNSTTLTVEVPSYNGDGDLIQDVKFVPAHLSNGFPTFGTIFAPASTTLANYFTYTLVWWRFHIPDALDFQFPDFHFYAARRPDLTLPEWCWLLQSIGLSCTAGPSDPHWPFVAFPPTLWWTLESPPDHNGWWGSSASMGGDSFLLNSTDRPVAPRTWAEIATFATGSTAMLGGSPGAGCIINNRLIYPASTYQNSYPTVRLYNGRSDYQLCLLPPAASGSAPYTIMSMLSANGTVYVSTIDSGSDSTNWVGRVFSLDILSGVMTPLGSAFTTGHVPYALTFHNGRLWCGTHRQSTAAVGKVRWIRPGIDTDWTDDHTLATGSVASLISFQGQLYVGTTDAAGTFALLLKRDTSGVYTTADTGSGGTARASNGWLALSVYNNTLFASYWNDDTVPVSKIRKSSDGASWSTSYTGSGGTNRPYIGFTQDKTFLLAIAGGLSRTAAVVRTPDGTNWTDETVFLETTNETALPIFGTVIL